MRTIEPGKLPLLTDAQVRSDARPGESWEQARKRLERANWACPPEAVDEREGADYTIAGPIDEYEGLDGRPIQWEPGELGYYELPL